MIALSCPRGDSADTSRVMPPSAADASCAACMSARICDKGFITKPVGVTP